MNFDRERIWKIIEQHLNNDYRDPQPLPLPPVEYVVPDHDEPVSLIPARKKEDSVRELRSDTPVWDTIRVILKKMRGMSYTALRNKQREIIFNMPAMTEREKRRLSMPPRDYVLLELKEDGYTYAAYQLERLMKKHDQLREPIPPEQIVDKPIKEMNKTIIFLGDILKQANIYRKIRNVEKEFSLYFHVARHYELKNKRYWTWLAKEFYHLAALTVRYYTQDWGYSRALINYMFGRYLLFKGKNAIQARRRLQIAYESSEGKPWGSMWATNVSFEKISLYSSYLLHIAQLLTANAISFYSPVRALALTKQAVRIARRRDWHPDLEEAMLDLAIYYTRNKKHDEAICTLLQLKDKIISDEKNRDMFISIQVLLALCYKRGRRKEEALQQLLYLVELGREWDNPKLVAFGHKYLAKYLLEKDRVVTARKFLISTILLNKKLGNFNDLLESVYLHGLSKAKQHLKEYIELMIEANSPDHPAFTKLLDFVTYNKPFWKVKNLKKYVVTKNLRPLLSQKQVITASDKIYLLLRNKFGEQFADYAMEEITDFGRKPLLSDKTNYFYENPTEETYFDTRKEAEAYRDFLKQQYEGRNKILQKRYGEELCFEIERREIEDESQEYDYIRSLEDIEPIIPYEKDSPLYKQAVNLIQENLRSKNLATSKNIIIDVTNPKILIRLLNTIVDSQNIIFKFDGPIDFDKILEEIIRQRSAQQNFVESLPDVLKLRFSSETPVKMDKTKPRFPTECLRPDEINNEEFYTDDEIEQNRDKLFNNNFFPFSY